MKRIIDVEEPQVGERYLVPVVRELRVGPRGLRIVGDLWVPVIGPLHDDTEIIGLPARHWHVDFRFAGARVLLRMATIRPPITADGDDDLVEKCMTRVITDDPEWTWAGREDGERALTMLRGGRRHLPRSRPALARGDGAAHAAEARWLNTSARSPARPPRRTAARPCSPCSTACRRASSAT
jgi:hypothetical protein